MKAPNLPGLMIQLHAALACTGNSTILCLYITYLIFLDCICHLCITCVQNIVYSLNTSHLSIFRQDTILKKLNPYL